MLSTAGQVRIPRGRGAAAEEAGCESGCLQRAGDALAMAAWALPATLSSLGQNSKSCHREQMKF